MLIVSYFNWQERVIDLKIRLSYTLMVWVYGDRVSV
jgi:hypothetical protein